MHWNTDGSIRTPDVGLGASEFDVFLLFCGRLTWYFFVIFSLFFLEMRMVIL